MSKTGRWFPGDVEERWTSPPPHGVGSTRHAVVTMFGRRSENDAVTTAYDPPFRAAMQGTNAERAVSWSLFIFAPNGIATEVKVVSRSPCAGRRRVLGPLVAFVYG